MTADSRPRRGKPRRANAVADARIEIRATPEEKQAYEAAAANRGISVAEYVRRYTLPSYVALPVDVDEGQRPPRLRHGDVYLVRLPSGETELATWDDDHRYSCFRDECGEQVDVAGVWVDRWAR